MRMGLRYVRNLGEAEVSRIEAARTIGGEFTSPTDLAHRTGLPVDAYEGLSAAGALESIGLARREGLWVAGALADIDPERLPLTPGLGTPEIEEMDMREEHLADLWAVQASTSHPIQFVRDQITQRGCVPIADVLTYRRMVRKVRVGGVVTHRQRPGTAAGVIFFNLEDETGLLNIVVLPPVWAEYKPIARRVPALIVEGMIEYRDGVTNLVARSFEPIEVQAAGSRDFR
jgi:error-prone DNA polymerase